MIEHNIPIPSDKPEVGLTAYLKALGVNDSFILPPEFKREGIYQCAKQINIKTLSRKNPDGSIRVWRIA